MSDMDLFDRRILAVSKDGKPREFQRLLGEVGFSHNTLRQHLTRLESQGLLVKGKRHQKGPGRPRFAYHVPSRLKGQVILSLEDPYTRLVDLPFRKLQHLCRFEKGGYCKKIKDRCAPQNCPQIPKEE